MFFVTNATDNIRIMETIRNRDCSRYASLTNSIQFVVPPGAVTMPGQPAGNWVSPFHLVRNTETDDRFKQHKWILHSIGNPYCHMNTTSSVLMNVMMVICYSMLLLLSVMAMSLQ